MVVLKKVTGEFPPNWGEKVRACGVGVSRAVHGLCFEGCCIWALSAGTVDKALQVGKWLFAQHKVDLSENIRE